MALAWVAQRRTGNSGWVNTIWTFSVGLVGRRNGAGAASIIGAPRSTGSPISMRIVMRSRLRCGLYDDDTALWMRRWPWFFLATAGLFGPAGGAEWGGSHHRMKVSA